MTHPRVLGIAESRYSFLNPRRLSDVCTSIPKYFNVGWLNSTLAILDLVNQPSTRFWERGSVRLIA